MCASYTFDEWMDRRNENRHASLSHLSYRVARRMKLNNIKVFENHKAAAPGYMHFNHFFPSFGSSTQVSRSREAGA